MVRDKGIDFEPADGENGWSEWPQGQPARPPTLEVRPVDKHRDPCIIKEEEELTSPADDEPAWSEEDLTLSEQEPARSRHTRDPEAVSAEDQHYAPPPEPRISPAEKPEPTAAVPDADRSSSSAAGPSPSASADTATLCREARDAVERIWASVFYCPEHPAPKSLVVSAAEPGEGVSQIAAALALVGCAAERGLRIALVDFNLGRPMLHRILNLQPTPGVAEILAGRATLATAVQQIEQGRLGVLAAGRVRQVVPDLALGRQAGTLIRDLAAAYDHVIVDTPPVNSQSTVQALAGGTDGVLLVTNAAVTRRQAVAEAIKRVELAQGKVIGIVLNQRRFPIPDIPYRRT